MHCKVGAKIHIVSLFTKHSFQFSAKWRQKRLPFVLSGEPAILNRCVPNRPYLMFRFSFVPLRDGGENTHADHFVTQFAQVSIALVQSCLLFCRAVQSLAVAAISRDGGFHVHNDMVIFLIGYVSTCRPAERFSPIAAAIISMETYAGLWNESGHAER